jgi:hypothetical protein
MPLFLLPFLYTQLALTSATNYWAETDGQVHSPSLPCPEMIEQVLR